MDIVNAPEPIGLWLRCGRIIEHGNFIHFEAKSTTRYGLVKHYVDSRSRRTGSLSYGHLPGHVLSAKQMRNARGGETNAGRRYQKRSVRRGAGRGGTPKFTEKSEEDRLRLSRRPITSAPRSRTQ